MTIRKESSRSSLDSERSLSPNHFLLNNILPMNITLHKTSEAEGFIPTIDSKGKPITVIGTDAIRDHFDETCLRQALNSRSAPGVTDLVLNPDAHAGYGAPVGCVSFCG